MRPKTELKRIAELAFMYSIPSMVTKKPKRSRLGSLFLQLQKVTGKEINRFHKIAQEERLWLEGQLEKFGDATGWESTPKHISTVLSFSLALAERMDDLGPRVLEKLNLNNIASLISFAKVPSGKPMTSTERAVRSGVAVGNDQLCILTSPSRFMSDFARYTMPNKA